MICSLSQGNKLKGLKLLKDMFDEIKSQSELVNTLKNNNDNCFFPHPIAAVVLPIL